MTGIGTRVRILKNGAIGDIIDISPRGLIVEGDSGSTTVGSIRIFSSTKNGV